MKVLVKLFQKLVGSKGNALAVRRNGRNTLCVGKRRKVVKKTLAGGFLKCEASSKLMEYFNLKLNSED